MNTMHPIFEQALRPFMPPTPADRALAADFAGPAFLIDEAAAFHEANDAQALRLQMARPQTVEGWPA